MSSTVSRLFWAQAYHALLQDIFPQGMEESSSLPAAPGEMEVQSYWAAGLLGSEGETLRHGHVKILDFGIWNRSTGPDFLRAEIELNGQRLRGDIEIDPTAKDWENHGHGANPAFNNVVLHVVLDTPSEGWYTRNSEHRDVPILAISRSVLQQAAGLPNRRENCTIPCCRTPLENMDAEEIQGLLKAAAAHRLENKRTLFRRKAEHLGIRQTWYEAWAETLGYAVNKETMRMLARRAPIRELSHAAEAILLGTAGFLVPVLPDKCAEEARMYHRHVWDAWWELREHFELHHSHKLPWTLAPIRPMNHPQRRVAALAVSASRWKQIEPHLLNPDASALRRILSELSHPFWDTHCTLSSGEMSGKHALVGESRIDDFLINHVYAQDERPFAWDTYLSLKAKQTPTWVQRIAALLFGERKDMQHTLRHHYAQQALLQIDSDFCAHHSCHDCLFPEQLRQWKN